MGPLRKLRPLGGAQHHGRQAPSQGSIMPLPKKIAPRIAHAQGPAGILRLAQLLQRRLRSILPCHFQISGKIKAKGRDRWIQRPHQGTFKNAEFNHDVIYIITCTSDDCGSAPSRRDR